MDFHLEPKYTLLPVEPWGYCDQHKDLIYIYLYIYIYLFLDLRFVHKLFQILQFHTSVLKIDFMLNISYESGHNNGFFPIEALFYIPFV